MGGWGGKEIGFRRCCRVLGAGQVGWEAAKAHRDDAEGHKVGVGCHEA